MEAQSPNFDSIMQVNPYGIEYWSARDLAPLLGYNKWQNFVTALNRAVIACQQIGQVADDHFTGISKMISLGKGAQREVKDWFLTRFACYLIAQNGDPRKAEIAQAQAYFAVTTREFEIQQLREEQDKRLRLRERVSENNQKLAEAAYAAGVLSRSFGAFQNAGYRGLYDGQDVDGVKARKQIGPKEDVLDRMGRAELAANDFRITQTEQQLRKEGIIGQAKATETHFEVGHKVRKAIQEIGGIMPEDLPAEPTIKPLLEAKRRQRKTLPAANSPKIKTDPEEEGQLESENKSEAAPKKLEQTSLW